MMKLLGKIEDLALMPGPTHLAIGVFDGIHLGHQAVINRAVRNARQAGGSAVVVTFDPHPVRVLRPEKAPRLLMSFPQKTRLVEEVGIDAMLTITFTREFSKTPPELFITRLHSAANELREICVGEGWRFGANRAGESCFLESMARQLGIKLSAVSPVLIDDRVVSSTRVRAALDRGDLDGASQLLGRPFALWGTVDSGTSLASQFRVAPGTLGPNNIQFPPDGMYAVRAGRHGKEYRGAVNIGWVPMGEQYERFVQMHILGPNRPISGEPKP
jgi:riboflavin kinase / FMN adenylyltransferase